MRFKRQCWNCINCLHNPPEYNGYKVYNQQGGQIVPPEDEAIMQHINALTYEDIRWETNEKHLFSIDKEIDEAYTKTIIDESFLTAQNVKTPKFFLLHYTVQPL